MPPICFAGRIRNSVLNSRHTCSARASIISKEPHTRAVTLRAAAASAEGATPVAAGVRGSGRGPGVPPEEFIDYCHSLGLGGAEVAQPPTDAAGIARLKDKIQSYDMHVIFNIPLPAAEADLDRF